METRHEVIFSDARTAELEEGSVDLVVTSPPYPMIEMWDEMFSEMSEDIEEALQNGDGEEAFELMHEVLDKVWDNVDSAVKEGGIVCVNVGDATRKIGGDFEMFPNHSRIIEYFTSKGYRQLPGVLWRKPTNSAAKFMGSGMLPPNAYVTLEHEHILVFKKGSNRSFNSTEKRYSSAYFWEERNNWFSDLWEDVTGTLQKIESSELRDRSAAYPFEIPYRLINMYSVQGDTVIDPFWGTGTTTLAAIASGRNSVGIEIEEEFSQVFERELDMIKEMTSEINAGRIERHIDFVESEDREFKYENEEYGFPVTTKQEKQLKLPSVEEVEKQEKITVEHGVFDPEDATVSSSETLEDHLK